MPEQATRYESVVKLQHAKCPGATPIARGRHQGVSLMRPQRTTLPVQCARCGAVFSSRPGRRYCSWACRYAPEPIQITADGSSAMIPLRARDGSVKAYAYVDAADAEIVNRWHWTLLPDGYVIRVEKQGGRQRCIRMHRELLGHTTGDGLEVDHIDGNRQNNRRANLRDATPLENSQNLPAQRGRTSRHRGVSFNRALGKWHARVLVNGQRHHLGFYADELEAAEAARTARLRLMPFTVESRSEAPS